MKDLSEVISEVIVGMNDLISHSSTKAVIEALKHQGITLTQEQKDEMLKTIRASNFRYLEKKPFFADALKDASADASEKPPEKK